MEINIGRKSTLGNQVPLILKATETVRADPFILSRSETGTSILVVWEPRPSNCSIKEARKGFNT